MKKMLCCLLLCLAVCSTSVVGAELTPDQFAFGLSLETSGDQAFYELSLPLAVYQASHRTDLGDIRVFNAAGQVVPHALRHPDNQTRQEDVVTTELPFFPLVGQSRAFDDDLSVHVERTSEGTIVEILTEGRDEAQEAQTNRSYLIDASGLKRRIDALELLWAADSAAFLAELAVETSQDLVSWTTLTTAAVGRLVYQDFRLDQNKIVLPRANSRYLRFTWPAGQPVAALAKVLVLTRQSYISERPPQRRLTLASEPVADRRYRVDLGGALPVSAATIIFPDKNSLAVTRLFSANEANGPMRQRWQGLVYTLAANGSIVSNDAITLSPSRQRYWELAINESEATLSTAPKLELVWQPDRLVFLAQGSGPYTLAYGHATVKPTNFPVDTLLKRSTAATQASLQPQSVEPGTPFALAGPDAATHQSLPWEKYLLWGVLFLGVLLIGGMSFSLYRSLRDTESP